MMGKASQDMMKGGIMGMVWQVVGILIIGLGPLACLSKDFPPDYLSIGTGVDTVAKRVQNRYPMFLACVAVHVAGGTAILLSARSFSRRSETGRIALTAVSWAALLYVVLSTVYFVGALTSPHPPYGQFVGMLVPMGLLVRLAIVGGLVVSVRTLSGEAVKRQMRK